MTLALEKYCIEADLGTQILIFLYTTRISLSLEEIKFNEKENNTNRLETTMVRFMVVLACTPCRSVCNYLQTLT